MAKEKKEVCSKCGKVKVEKPGTGAFGNKKRKVCPDNCKPAKGWGN
jgi:hypothetical protein